jgi:hypothetical protein
VCCVWLEISIHIIIACKAAKIIFNENLVGSSQVAAFADQTGRKNNVPVYCTRKTECLKKIYIAKRNMADVNNSN